MRSCLFLSMFRFPANSFMHLSPNLSFSVFSFFGFPCLCSTPPPLHQIKHLPFFLMQPSAKERGWSQSNHGHLCARSFGPLLRFVSNVWTIPSRGMHYESRMVVLDCWPAGEDGRVELELTTKKSKPQVHTCFSGFWDVLSKEWKTSAVWDPLYSFSVKLRRACFCRRHVLLQVDYCMIAYCLDGFPGLGPHDPWPICNSLKTIR